MDWNPSSLESISCDACGHRKHHTLYVRRDGLPLVRCEGCGLAFINPRPKEAEIQKLYSADYFDKAGTPSGIGASLKYLDPFMAEQRRFHARVLANLLAQHLRLRGSRVLEVGCASGDFAYHLARHGAQVVALDLSSEIIQVAHNKFPRIDFRVGEIDSTELEPGTFDAVCAVMVLEHVLSPVRFLRRMKDLMKPGGCGLIVVPNLAAGERVGLSRWLGIQDGFEHLHYFTPASLAALGLNAGLSTTQWYTSGGSGAISVSSSSVWRRRVRAIAFHMRILNLIRLCRWIATPSSLSYLPEGEGSSLACVLRRPAQPGIAPHQPPCQTVGAPSRLRD